VSDTDTKEVEDSGLGVILAIAAGIIAAAIGVVGTYVVMTSVLEFKLEPNKSIYDDSAGKSKEGGGPGGKGGMMGGKGGMMGGKGGGKGGMGGGKGPGGQGEKGANPPGGAS
jgi:hypothetical protein